MNYTENYHLPQWVKTDRIMMDDFNAAMASLEDGLTTAQATADEAVRLPYAAGSYVGNGVSLWDGQDINLGFRPSFVIVSGQKEVHGYYTGTERYFVATAGTVFSTYITLTDTGFHLSYSSNDSPNLNEADHVYDYIAFR